MKKQLTSLLVCASALLWANNAQAQFIPDELKLPYEIMHSFGRLAKCSDLVGIGVVLPGVPAESIPDDWRHLRCYFVLRIEQPFWGCVSNQEIRVFQRGSEPGPPHYVAAGRPRRI